MTGIDRIKTKILDDAKEIAEENLNRARQEAERIIAEARGKAREEAGKARQAAKAEAANLKKQWTRYPAWKKENACSRSGRTW